MIRVHATLHADGTVTGKVTAHAEYAEDRTASTEVEFGELSEKTRTAIAAVLRSAGDEAKPRLDVRLGDAVYQSRQVALANKEITR